MKMHRVGESTQASRLGGAEVSARGVSIGARAAGLPPGVGSTGLRAAAEVGVGGFGAPPPPARLGEGQGSEGGRKVRRGRGAGGVTPGEGNELGGARRRESGARELLTCATWSEKKGKKGGGREEAGERAAASALPRRPLPRRPGPRAKARAVGASPRLALPGLRLPPVR